MLNIVNISFHMQNQHEFGLFLREIVMTEFHLLLKYNRFHENSIRVMNVFYSDELFTYVLCMKYVSNLISRNFS